ncbi:hypothetical protein D3C84_1068110 [compost metagenome]
MTPPDSIFRKPWIMAFSTSGCRNSFGTLAPSSPGSISNETSNRSSKRLFIITM